MPHLIDPPPAEPPVSLTLLVQVHELVVRGRPPGWYTRTEPLVVTGSPARIRAVRALARPGFEIGRTDFKTVTVV